MLLLLLMATGAMGDDYRLPLTVVPRHYSIKLVPYFQERNFTFDGEIAITVAAVSDSDNITLHYDSLEILEAPSVVSADGLQALDVVETSYDNVTNFYTLQLNDTLEPEQEYVIRIKYIGDLKHDMAGFYKISYNTTNNETRWLAVTQFEPTEARKAFPCFDEPALKAKFQINIARTEDYHSISNMPLENTSDPDSSLGGRVWDSFKETPLMSTYLVAFVVSDLKNLTTEDGKYSVWIREEVMSQGKYALSIAPNIIKAMEEYTEIKYELPKLDQVAIPDMFFWAMENWGLVTLWEGHMTHPDGTSTAETKQDTLQVVTHEFAHLWFSDLVSPKWWDYLWLNEGFATYFEYLISSKIEPDWQLDKLFVVEMHQTALLDDSYNTSHPMTHKVSTSDEINKIFDSISYDKAASVIRSMQHFLTAETLRKGLSKYLKQHSHGATEPDDLFSILDEQQKSDGILPSDMDVKTIMDSWTLQAGYPVVHVSRVNGGILLTQERFLLRGSDDSDGNRTWWLPVSYTTSAELNFTDTKPRAWLRSQPQLSLDININEDEWIILNLQATGFYRVNYDQLTWLHLTEQMRSPQYHDIHMLNRAQLIDDAFNLARAGLLNYTLALNLSTYLDEEKSSIPWHTYVNTIRFLNRQLYDSTSYDHFKKYCLDLLGNLYASIGFRTELTHEKKMIQPLVTQLACVMHHKDCVANAIELFSKWMSNPQDKKIIPVDLRTVVHCTAARNNRKMWDFIWKQVQVESNDDEQWVQYYALGCTEDKELLKRYLNMSLSENTKTDTLTSNVYFILHNSQKGVDATLDFLTDNFPQVLNKTEDKDILKDIIEMIADEVTTRQQADRLLQLVEDNEVYADSKDDENISDTMEEHITWTEKHYDTVANWLSDYVNEKRR